MTRASMRLRAGVVGATAYQRLRDVTHGRIRPAGALTDVLRHVRSFGWAILPDLVARSWCHDAIAELERAYGQYETVLDDVGSDERLWGAEHRTRTARSFAEHPKLSATASAYQRCDVEVMTTMAGHLTAVPGNPGSGGGWHRDNAFLPQFKAILYLTHVGPDNGPFQYVTGSHRLRSVLDSLDIDSRRGLTRFEEHEFTAETIVGPAGTVVLADTRGVHRGAPILVGERWALTNYYFPVHRRSQFREWFDGVPGIVYP